MSGWRREPPMNALETLDERLVSTVAHKRDHPLLDGLVAGIGWGCLPRRTRRQPDMDFLQIEQTENVLDRRGSSEVAEAATVLDQPLSAQARQRLAHRARAQMQRRGDVADRKVLSGCETLAQSGPQTVERHAEGITRPHGNRPRGSAPPRSPTTRKTADPRSDKVCLY